MGKKSIYVDDIREIEKKRNQRDSTFNGLTANEWTVNSKSVWNDIPSPKKATFYTNGEIIPIEVCDKIISNYSKEEDRILDPFMGTGNVVISAIQNNRYCYGFEINNEFYDISRRNVDSSMNLLINGDYNLKQGNALHLMDTIEDNSIQLILTSPSYPISNGTDDTDFSMMNEEIYKNKMSEFFNLAYKKVRPGGYCIFIVKDYRDIKNGRPYVSFHNLISELGCKEGFLLHDLIVYDVNDQKGLILLGYPSVFYANINHSFIVVLRKQKI